MTKRAGLGLIELSGRWQKKQMQEDGSGLLERWGIAGAGVWLVGLSVCSESALPCGEDLLQEIRRAGASVYKYNTSPSLMYAPKASVQVCII